MRNKYLLENYRLKWDYHTHTVYSHGKGTIEDNVKAAVDKGLSAIAISDHGPGHLTYGIKRSAVAQMRADIEALKPKYPEIEIFLSVEANIVNHGNYLDVTKEEFGQYDFVNAGYHFGIPGGYMVRNWLYSHGIKTQGSAKSLMVKNTDMTVKALYENKIKILTHPGDKGPFDLGEIAKACEDTGTLMEINFWHHHLNVEEIAFCAEYDVSFVISSDAHHPSRVGNYEESLLAAIEAGLPISRIVNIEGA
ncbi:MAG: PHP domain-containing protein [Peptostreptococcaceae bacterium]|nr:PHP domain-containing protein [Peptostreptococcaceae bacterium]MDY5739490.1 PHP domain-containing protein [Anaerovoracaceae bacterium]